MSKLELHKSESFQFGNLCPENKCSIGNLPEATSTAKLVEPVLPITGQESGKQEQDVPGVEVILAGDQTAEVVEPVLCVKETGQESGKHEDVTVVEVVHREDQMAGVHLVEPVPPVHDTGPESSKHEETVPGVEVVLLEDQNATKPVSSNR